VLEGSLVLEGSSVNSHPRLLLGGQLDPYHVKPDGRSIEPLLDGVSTSQPDELSLFAPIDGLCRHPILFPPAGLHLDKNQHFSFAGNDIDLSQTTTSPSFHDPVAVFGELPAGEVFPSKPQPNPIL
jgi:hypothetical protein